MVYLSQPVMIRRAAQAALEQNKLTPSAFEQIVRRIEGLPTRSRSQPDERAIRQAAAVMIRRLCSTPTPGGAADWPEVPIAAL